MSAPVEPSVPTAEVVARCAVLASAEARTHSPSDRLAYRWDVRLEGHPEWCSTEADYPGWVPPHTEGYYPDTSNPVDFARSDSEGFVTPVVWDDSPVCEPEFPAARRVEDVQTGRAL